MNGKMVLVGLGIVLLVAAEREPLTNGVGPIRESHDREGYC